jgi:protein-S-isoprenylcysteine O-methyltransferase Ste14
MGLDPWFAKGAFLAATIVFVAIRAPHGQRSRTIAVVKSRKGRLEVALLTLAGVGSLLPLLWVATPALAFADYPLRPAPLVAGILGLALGLWYIYRSHADLGRNWSVTLEIRDGHRLVTDGVYRRVRHPMYLGFLLYSAGQALAIPNGVAGPTFLVAFALLFALRVGPEERMMLDAFGAEYEAYMARTRRVVPWSW